MISDEDKILFATGIGDIIGRREGGVIKASAIPYGRAGRFELPVPVEKLPSPFEAFDHSPLCPQTRDRGSEDFLGKDIRGQVGQSEDCLNLSVTIPQNRWEEEKLPVMVWIHGGGYVTGGGDVPMFDPEPLVEEQRIICVSLTFRLGLFGFLGGYKNRPANLGLFDIIEALKWIQKHIAAFGGDRENVTLFGQSAGGDAIAHLMIADGAEGLFHNAIIQSAPLGLIHGKKPLTDRMIGQAENLPVSATIDEVLDCQKKALRAAGGFGLRSGMPFGVQYGHAPLPVETDLEEQWRRKAGTYNVMIGYTKRETAIFIPFLTDLDRIWNIPLLGSFIKKILIRETTMIIYGRPAVRFARRLGKKGGRGYFYRIDWGSEQNDLGPAHTIDLPLLFGRYNSWKKSELIKGISQSELERTGSRIRQIWGEFARYHRINLPVQNESGIVVKRF